MKYKLINLILLIILVVVSVILIVFRLGKDNKISNIKKLYYSLSGGMSYNSDTKYELICGEECVLNIKIPYQLEKRG